MSTESTVEIAVVGGGPAGAAAAIFLARLGRSCAVLERSRPGSAKLCGEFLSPDAFPLLRATGVHDELASLAPPEVDRVRIIGPGGRSWESLLPAAGWGLSRDALDESLLARAASEGVRVLRGFTVRRWIGAGLGETVVEATGVDGALRIGARAVLLATGKASALATGAPEIGPSRLLAFQAHHEGPTLGSRVELHAFAGGYVGLIDLEGGRRNLCMLVRRDVAGPMRPETALAEGSRSSPSLAAWLARARRVAPWTSTPRIELSRTDPVPIDGPIRLGDAAGLLAPLLGDGRSMALRSAQIAAPIVFDFLRGRLDGASARDAYREAWHAEFDRRIRAGRLLHSLLVHPAALGASLAVLSRIPSLGRIAIQGTRGPTGVIHGDAR